MTPTLRVEVAFGFQPYDAEPLAIDWDDITSDVYEVSIQRGRKSEFDRFPASTATVTLRNDDRKYDPLNTSSVYNGQLVANIPIRIVAEIDSTDYPVWRGYIDGWPADYTEAGYASEVKVTCTDAFKILAERYMPDTLSKFLDGFAPGRPSTWYRMDSVKDFVLLDAEGSKHMDIIVAAERVDGLLPTSNGAVSFPELLTPDVLTYGWAAQRPIADSTQHITGGTTWTMAMTVQITKPTTRLLYGVFNNAGTSVVSVFLGNPAGSSPGTAWVTIYRAAGPNWLETHSSTVITDGRPHRLVVVRDDDDVYVYVDGQLEGSSTTAGIAGQTITADAGLQTFGAAGGNTEPFTSFVMDEVMVWQTALTAAQVTELDEALTVGFSANRTTGQAIDDVLDEVSWSPTLRDIPTGEAVVQLPANPGGRTVLSLLQKIADSEAGRFFVDHGGRLTMHSRSRDVSEFPLAAYTFTDNNRDTTPTDVGLLDGVLSITLDDRLTWDAAEVTRDGGITQRAANTATPLRTYKLDGLLFANDLQALSLAQWYPFRYGVAQPRSESWKIDPEIVAGDWADILDLEIGHRVAIEITPGGVGSAIGLEQHIGYIGHDITPERWIITLNGTPVDPNDYLLWDSSESPDDAHGWADSDGDPAGGAWG